MHKPRPNYPVRLDDDDYIAISFRKDVTIILRKEFVHSLVKILRNRLIPWLVFTCIALDGGGNIQNHPPDVPRIPPATEDAIRQ